MELNNNTTFVIQEIILTGLDGLPYPKLVGAAILLVLLLILFGSFTNIAVIVSNKDLHCPMYILICSLAVVDILYTSSMSTTMLNVLLGEQNRVKFSFCVLQHFVFHLGTHMEPLTITLMAFDRLIAISYPLRYNTILTNRNIFLLLVVIWTIGTTLSAVWSFTVNSIPYCISVETPYPFCDFPGLVRTACVDPKFYLQIASTAFNCVLWTNCCLIVVSYLRIVYAVIKMSSSTDRKKTFSTCICHIIVVACFFFPKMLITLSNMKNIGFSPTSTIRNGMSICSTLGPSLVNPYIYGIHTKEIRNRVTLFFKKILFLNKVRVKLNT